MSNSFYARYIPPKTNASKEHKSAKFVSSDQSSQSKRTAGFSENSDLDQNGNAAVENANRETESHALKSHKNSSERRKKNAKKSKDADHRSHATSSTKDLNEFQNGHDSVVEIANDAEEKQDESEVQAVSAQSSKSLKRKRTNQNTIKADSIHAQHDTSKDETSRKHSNILSKFEKSMKRSEEEAKNQNLPEEATEKPIVNNLEPLPLPKQPEESLPTFSALPKWLESPTNAENTAVSSFEEFDVCPEILSRLRDKGYIRPSKVQAAVLPLLLPTQHQHPGDLCVSAPTGSGKTLAYALPILQSLVNAPTSKLQALIIVPTRELVHQVHHVIDECNFKTHLSIGIASGSRPFKQEQSSLIQMGRKYDPSGYQSLRRRAGFSCEDECKSNESSVERLEDLIRMNEENALETEDDSEVDDDFKEMVFDLLPGNIPAYNSKCNILICTPGRLVDHIKSTKGFHLNDLEWLVIDEADRLLDQSFQEWTKVLLESIESREPQNLGHSVSSEDQWPANMLKSTSRKRVRKIVLSATMTRDLEKLQSLKFRVPKLVLVGTESVGASEKKKENNENSNEMMTLPSTLQEWAIPVGDGAEKPLYLLEFLQSEIFAQEMQKRSRKKSQSGQELRRIDSSNEDDSESSSDASSFVSSMSSASSSASSEDPKDDMSEGEHDKQNMHDDTPNIKAVSLPMKAQTSRGVLVFVNSNENATRLARLLSILHPPYANKLDVMKKGATSKSDAKILESFRKGHISVLIASDRASRGLDIPNLTDVVNYDMPRSINSYVHRVGRTARAGRTGESWTLFTDTEAGWFWNHVARAPALGRGLKSVGRRKMAVHAHSERMRKSFEEALKQLEREVLET